MISEEWFIESMKYAKKERQLLIDIIIDYKLKYNEYNLLI